MKTRLEIGTLVYYYASIPLSIVSGINSLRKMVVASNITLKERCCNNAFSVICEVYDENQEFLCYRNCNVKDIIAATDIPNYIKWYKENGCKDDNHKEILIPHEEYDKYNN